MANYMLKQQYDKYGNFIYNDGSNQQWVPEYTTVDQYLPVFGGNTGVNTNRRSSGWASNGNTARTTGELRDINADRNYQYRLSRFNSELARMNATAAAMRKNYIDPSPYLRSEIERIYNQPKMDLAFRPKGEILGKGKGDASTGEFGTVKGPDAIQYDKDNAQLAKLNAKLESAIATQKGQIQADIDRLKRKIDNNPVSEKSKNAEAEQQLKNENIQASIDAKKFRISTQQGLLALKTAQSEEEKQRISALEAAALAETDQAVSVEILNQLANIDKITVRTAVENAKNIVSTQRAEDAEKLSNQQATTEAGWKRQDEVTGETRQYQESQYQQKTVEGQKKQAEEDYVKTRDKQAQKMHDMGMLRNAMNDAIAKNPSATSFVFGGDVWTMTQADMWLKQSQQQVDMWSDDMARYNAVLTGQTPAVNMYASVNAVPPVVAGSSSPASGWNSQSIPTITTQQEFDKLPSGTVYIDANDGKKWTKP